MTGSHTWASFQDITSEKDSIFDWKEYLEMLIKHNHNFIRLWVWEQKSMASWTKDVIYFNPLPYKAKVMKGKTKFDLDQWNEEYFDRLLKRVQEAQRNGIYVSVMLFQGWSQNKSNTSNINIWANHPFNPENNIQQAGKNVKDFDLDSERDNTLHSTQNGDILEYQKRYIKKILLVLENQDNVLYEIINEGGTVEWQYAMIDYIKETEKSMKLQHPVGMTHAVSVDPMMHNSDLMASNADWISPANEPQSWVAPGSTYLQDYQNDPVANTGNKVIINDTDHLWGHGGNPFWVWKSFLRGLNPIFMDPWRDLAGELDKEKMTWMFIDGGICKDDRYFADYELIRLNMGYTRKYAERLDLINMRPMSMLSTTKYCLANPGYEYLIYFPESGTATVDLRETNTSYDVEWFIPQLNKTIQGAEKLVGGKIVVVTAPFNSGDAVLYLKSEGNNHLGLISPNR
jgi:hypothetical protein